MGKVRRWIARLHGMHCQPTSSHQPKPGIRTGSTRKNQHRGATTVAAKAN